MNSCLSCIIRMTWSVTSKASDFSTCNWIPRSCQTYPVLDAKQKSIKKVANKEKFDAELCYDSRTYATYLSPPYVTCRPLSISLSYIDLTNEQTTNLGKNKLRTATIKTGGECFSGDLGHRAVITYCWISFYIKKTT